MSNEDSKTFAQEVWDVLSRIDVIDHTDKLPKTKKRPEISYLSWSMAWTLLKREFPGSTYAHRSDIRHPDETVEVEVDVVISNGTAETFFTNARLGVMDQWFNPIVNPSARQVNDTRQRALVKALAFAGLGLDLWADTSIPVGRLEDPITGKQVEELVSLIEASETDLDFFLEWCECETIAELPRERFTSARGLLEEKARRLKKEQTK